MKWLVLALLASGTGMLACTTDVVPIPPSLGLRAPATYDATLTVDSVSLYAQTDPRCANSPNTFYCWIYVSKPSVESAVFVVQPRAQGLPGDTIVFQGGRYGDHYGIATTDSLGRQVVKVAPLNDPPRGVFVYDYYTLTGLATGDAYDGTWYNQTDPHGANRIGTFHAVRRQQ